MIRLLAFVLPLGVDTFAVAAALGAARPAGIAMRLRVSLLFVIFEAGMPSISTRSVRPVQRARACGYVPTEKPLLDRAAPGSCGRGQDSQGGPPVTCPVPAAAR